ncbi:MAG: RHS repeat-associated core domain-containing protein [Planctomycetota bacterium]
MIALKPIKKHNSPTTVYSPLPASHYIQDGLGSIRNLVSSAEAVVNSYDYYGFGESLSASEQVSNRYRFTGREWDNESSTYRYRAREYNPASGRFTARDPIGYLGGINIYSYCGSNPVNWIDPSGWVARWPDDVGGEATDLLYRVKRDPWGRPINDEPAGADLLHRVKRDPWGRPIPDSESQVELMGFKESVDFLQTECDVIGLIPAVGEPFDAASGIISVFKGDWIGAGLSALALIPTGGQYFGGLKLVRKGKKILGKADDVADATKVGKNAPPTPKADTPTTKAPKIPDGSKDVNDLKRVSDQELRDAGIDAHKIKTGKGTDLYKDKDGNLYEVPKGGRVGEPTGTSLPK